MAASAGSASSAEAAPSVEQTMPGAETRSAAVCLAERAVGCEVSRQLAAGAGVYEALLGAAGVRSTAGSGAAKDSGGADSRLFTAVAAARKVLPAVSSRFEADGGAGVGAGVGRASVGADMRMAAEAGGAGAAECLTLSSASSAPWLCRRSETPSGSLGMRCVCPRVA